MGEEAFISVSANGPVIPDRTQNRTKHMSNHILPIAPSTDPVIAADQLEHALRVLADSGGTDNTRAYRPYLLQVIGHALEAIAKGASDEFYQDCKYVERMRRILENYVLRDLDTRTEAGIEILAAVRFLQTGIRVVAKQSLEQRSLNEQNIAILRILSRANTYLQRKEVHQRLEERLREETPSVSRVGQILKGLYEDDYLLRYRAPAQGGLTAFYALSPKGKALLEREPQRSTFREVIVAESQPRLTFGRARTDMDLVSHN